MKKGIEIYLDAADLMSVEKYIDQVSGVTTNPALMKKAGIKTYKAFANTMLKMAKGKPVSFEVLSDDFAEMEAQARTIQDWGDNVWVKIPITNTKGESSRGLIQKLSDLNLNVTAVMTMRQMMDVIPVMNKKHILSVFVGRITDTQNQVPKAGHGSCRWLWASTREVYSKVRAEIAGYDIITMTPDLIEKLKLAGKDLTEYSRETVEQFHNDGKGMTL